MKKHKTEFIKDSEHAAHLYVDGIKTNTWYFLPSYPHYNESFFCGQKARQNAETVKMLIDTGKITGRNWEGWDHCAFESYQIKALQIVEEIKYEHQIYGCSGYYDYLNPERQAAVIKELTGSIQNIQTLRRIIGNTFSDKTGIKFYPYGYSIGFIQ